MQNLKLQFTFDKEKVRSTQNKVLLNKNIPAENIVKNEITDNGDIYLELKSVDKIPGVSTIKELGKLPFILPTSSVEPVTIKFVEGSATLTGTDQATRIFMPDAKIEAKAPYKIAIDRASIGFDSKIKVVDEKGKPVEDAVVRVVNPNNELAVVKVKKAAIQSAPDQNSETLISLEKRDSAVIQDKQSDWLKVKYGKHEGWVKAVDVTVTPWVLGTTDDDDKLKTNRLAIFPGELIIQAQKGNRYSFETKVKVLDHLGSQKPEKTNLYNSEKGQ